MVRVCVRRNSDSQHSRAIYEAIKGICYQKQCPNEERILRFVLREFDWKPADILKQLHFAVEDGLFRESIAISHKGSKKGNEQMSYRIINTDNAVELDANGNSQAEELRPDEDSGHDWYCFDCQESGEVILCEFCPRVFHRKCAKAHYISQEEHWKCPSCKVGEENNSMSSLPKEKVAKMLEFTIKRLREKFSELTKHVSIEHCPDYDLYINHSTDLSCIETDVVEEKFASPGQFLEELKYILHNAIIYFGDDDEFTVMAEELIEDAKQEIEEMLLCPDCYYLSNSKPKDWFCQPCNPPHELVWAQMKSQPPWPAK
ncbi:Zinc finger MYND domain-containing 11, partial [Paramuricea clavata]